MSKETKSTKKTDGKSAKKSAKKSVKQDGKNFSAPDHVRAQVLEYMRDNRPFLFNQFSSVLMPNDKEDAWQRVVKFTNK